jgi:hypothetical protein
VAALSLHFGPKIGQLHELLSLLNTLGIFKDTNHADLCDNVIVSRLVDVAAISVAILNNQSHDGFALVCVAGRLHVAGRCMGGNMIGDSNRI